MREISWNLLKSGTISDVVMCARRCRSLFLEIRSLVEPGSLDQISEVAIVGSPVQNGVPQLRSRVTLDFAPSGV